ncbi:MAG: histidine phosphatase family protein [Succinivibrionaceae bacterium]|nr:histidine phosphatase family protein [Succinivibrionaceae bacterium]
MKEHNTEFTIYFVRHGKVTGEPSIYGTTDVDIFPIDEESVEKFIESQKIDSHFKIVSSPLLRCRKTCQVFNKFIKYSGEIEYMPEIQELDFGVLDGLPFSQYTKEQKELLTRIAAHPSRARIREAETLREFRKRIKGALKKLVSRHEDLVVFSHNGVIKMIFAELMKYNFRKDQLWLNLEFNYLAVLKFEGIYDKAHDVMDYRITLMPPVA